MMWHNLDCDGTEFHAPSVAHKLLVVACTFNKLSNCFFGKNYRRNIVKKGTGNVPMSGEKGWKIWLVNCVHLFFTQYDKMSTRINFSWFESILKHFAWVRSKGKVYFTFHKVLRCALFAQRTIVHTLWAIERTLWLFAHLVLMQANSLRQANNCPWPKQSITQASASW